MSHSDLSESQQLADRLVELVFLEKGGSGLPRDLEAPGIGAQSVWQTLQATDRLVGGLTNNMYKRMMVHVVAAFINSAAQQFSKGHTLGIIDIAASLLLEYRVDLLAEIRAEAEDQGLDLGADLEFNEKIGGVMLDLMEARGASRGVELNIFQVVSLLHHIQDLEAQLTGAAPSPNNEF
jgi:hypothetical protein